MASAGQNPAGKAFWMEMILIGPALAVIKDI